MAQTKQITFDLSLYRRKTEKLLDQIGKSKDEFLDEQAGLLFRDVAKYTPPWANGKLPKANANTYGTIKDKKAGQGAVVRDVFRSMRPVAPANRWKSPRVQEAIKSKDTKALKAIFDRAQNSVYQGWEVDLFDKKFHRRARDRRGRVRRQVKQLVMPKVEFNRYLKKIVKTVGQGKAYFTWASMEMGRNVPPAWISRHFYRHRASVRRTESGRSAVASHGSFIHTIRFLPRLIAYRTEAAEKRLLHLTKKSIKDAGFKSRAA